MTINISSKSLTWLGIAGLGSFFCYHLLKYVVAFNALVN